MRNWKPRRRKACLLSISKNNDQSILVTALPLIISVTAICSVCPFAPRLSAPSLAVTPPSHKPQALQCSDVEDDREEGLEGGSRSVLGGFFGGLLAFPSLPPSFSSFQRTSDHARKEPCMYRPLPLNTKLSTTKKFEIRLRAPRTGRSRALLTFLLSPHLSLFVVYLTWSLGTNGH